MTYLHKVEPHGSAPHVWMEVYREQVGMCRGGEHLHVPHGLRQVGRVKDQTVGERELVCRTLARFEHSLKRKCTCNDCLSTVKRESSSVGHLPALNTD